MSYQTVAEFYDRQSILVTGGTGFLGKVLLEKLLYSCPGIDKVYVLVREKSNENASQRWRKTLDQPLFARLKEEKPWALEKLIPIGGDISEPRLGLKEEDEQILLDKVSIIFHVAATVKFNEPFETAININVAGTGRIISLCRSMKQVKAFVYVSTAYSNTDRKIIEEVVYPAPASLSEVKKLIELGITDDQIEKLLTGRPNTYTFTKALAETLVAENHVHVPSVIVRPSVVSSSKNEPIIGWVDNWFGASALIATIAKGINRAILGNPSNSLDLIPVDYVSNLLIVAAAKTTRTKAVTVFNSCTSNENPINLQQLSKIIIKDTLKHKFNDVPMPFVIITKFKWLVHLITLLFQTIPAYIADLFLLIRGKKTMYTKIQERAILVRNALEYFTFNNWVICAPKTRALAQSLSATDKTEFPFDPSDINWTEYIPAYCQGIRRFLFNFEM